MENFLFETLSKIVLADVDFIICGGIACILQGSNRNSFDLDLNLDMSDNNLRKFIYLAKESNWIPRVPEPLESLLNPIIREKWIREKNAKVYTLNSKNSLLQIDIFLTYPIKFEELNKDASIFKVDNIKFKVSSIAHLIKAKKLITNKRRQDLFDIEILEELLNNKES